MMQQHGNHPIVQLKLTSRMLREQTSFAQRQAVNNASRARDACESIAALNMESSMRQLRQMIALLTS